jgi:hypothetical protein
VILGVDHVFMLAAASAVGVKIFPFSVPGFLLRVLITTREIFLVVLHGR